RSCRLIGWRSREYASRRIHPGLHTTWARYSRIRNHKSQVARRTSRKRPLTQDAPAGAEPAEVTDGRGRRLEGERLDPRRLSTVTERDVRRVRTEARFQSVAGHPEHVAYARVALEERARSSIGPLQPAQALQETLVQLDDGGRPLDGHPHGAGTMSATGDRKRQPRLTA